MQLTCKRIWFTDASSQGILYLDNGHSFYTLEDAVREIPGVDVENWKVPKKTAIPCGRYRVIIDFSKRFQRKMPHIINVPGFSGIRIHILNTAEETEGCIGIGRVREKDEILESKLAFDEFFPELETAIARGEEVWTTIENQPLLRDPLASATDEADIGAIA